MKFLSAACLVGMGFVSSALANGAAPDSVGSSLVEISGARRVWHTVTLTFRGPESSESGTPNPFRDYRLTVRFEHPETGDVRTVPGFFSADGNAAETSATAGDRWSVRFSPAHVGLWRWSVSFRTGRDVALALEAESGTPWSPLDGLTGVLTVLPTDKVAPDFRARGHLEYVGERYLRFAGDGRWFLKTGVNSPETLLGYFEFDGTYRDVRTDHRPFAPNPLIGLPSLQDGLLRFEEHARDGREGDPTWKGGRGRNLLGALNYLSAQGVNSAYFLTMNVNGDGRNVWPWVDPAVRDRFDCSKLDQWDRVFGHMTQLGIHLHIVTQETENDQLLDLGELGPERKLYYRELIARFAHHPAITWNLGEENVQSTAQQRACAAWLRRLNPYAQNIVVHNDHWHARNLGETFDQLLGHRVQAYHAGTRVPMDQEHNVHLLPGITGPSLQDFFWNDVHGHVVEYIRRSTAAGTPWVVSADELGGAEYGTLPDVDDPDHDAPRRFGLWGTLMGGGAGVEWYFGWQNNSPTSDLSAQDWRSRESIYRFARIAREFFEQELPFHRMRPADETIPGRQAWCLAADGEIHAIYLPNGGGTRFDLGAYPGLYAIHWFDPRSGGALREGTVRRVRGPGLAWTGLPPSEQHEDWLAVVRRVPEPLASRAVPGAEWDHADPLDAGVDPTGMHHALTRWKLHTGDRTLARAVVVRRGRVIFAGQEADTRERIDWLGSAPVRTSAGAQASRGASPDAAQPVRAEPVVLSAYDVARIGFGLLEGSIHSVSPAGADQADSSAEPQGPEIGAGQLAPWWSRNRDPAGGEAPLPSAPSSTVFALGPNHSVCVVIPEWDMVIVRLGPSGDAPGGDLTTLDGMLRRLAPAIYALPADPGSSGASE